MMLQKLCDGLKRTEKGGLESNMSKKLHLIWNPKSRQNNYNNLLLEVKKNVKAKAWEIRILQIHIGSQHPYLASSL